MQDALLCAWFFAGTIGGQMLWLTSFPPNNAPRHPGLRDIFGIVVISISGPAIPLIAAYGYLKDRSGYGSGY
jgi:hypothetical protein